MATWILSEFPPVCRDCGQPLDTQHQADGKGGSYLIVTCFNPKCDLRHVTRSLDTYSILSEQDLEAYRATNRASMGSV